MHNYSIDNNERIKILSIIGIISVYIKSYLNSIIESYLPGVIALFSALLIFSILFALYNNFLWKISYKIPFLKSTPNLNGKYSGFLKSSYDNYQQKHEVIVKVKQSWTKIFISLETTASKSCSRTASIVLNEKCDPVLQYFYQNDPNIDSSSTLEMHYGTCEHVFDKQKNTFNAWYYSSRGRKTTGTIELKKLNT